MKNKTEIRFVKYGGNAYYAIAKDDLMAFRDWDSAITETHMFKLQDGLAPPYIVNYASYVQMKGTTI